MRGNVEDVVTSQNKKDLESYSDSQSVADRALLTQP